MKRWKNLFNNLLLKIRVEHILGTIGLRNISIRDQTCRRILITNVEPIRFTRTTKNLKARIEITRNRHLRMRSRHEFRRLNIEFEAWIACFLNMISFLILLKMNLLFTICLCHCCVVFLSLCLWLWEMV